MTESNSSVQETVMDVNEIRKFLAHRYPFLLVDKVVQLEPGQSITAIKNVTINEPFFNGHFPEKPIMPGVLIVEAMAQATGLLGFKTMGDDPQPDLLYVLAGIDKVKFKHQVVPGDQLELYAEIIRHKGPMWIYKTEARVNGVVVTSAEIKCVATKTEK
ncbi:3-hydroxyacyl-ACP dehydratase FabZ [Cocleimonas flava]|jgi:3-hydroxyacyl-[acyl-carrier-protein] dehydratase|uniref:3-hydroxyacyl-[acyl-carrier-protein] dehydratase FabZ n=1 Tax=Cocleimonas flava TaxID=634765 RepID=A0A4R1F7P6_9GAMM|nr:MULTISPECIES: 3-hydroxyacyl-ACP dehydratase FabZ [Cocleimonas]MEB8431015.1 3-hydroxyacyl-ACP dehydratase FabZ [Cocleimonas sp. KMM 6892]MEC4714213.1 3-hydroxyacyl-ACP dehydratase FabZ [Cocleimonas sp. KMM 6895]MEC4743544.1 3-hydroxyacyl-ACP dehydratase FabZ [Cocleimonas sp. KMM 6896]TCJ88712.1 3-hydroxyacyl-[acyl-carrier-protein] dehydratase [Cocleimonas flava]